MVSTPGGDDAPCAVFLGRSVDEVVRRYQGRLSRLRNEGFEVHVLAGPGDKAHRLAEQGIHWRPIPVRIPGNLAGLAGAYFIVQAHLIETEPLLVHAFGHRLAWMGAFAAHRVGVPAVFVTLEYHWLEEDPLHVPLGPLASMGVPQFIAGAERGLNAAVGPAYRRGMQRAYRWLGEHVDRYIVTTEFDLQLAQDMDLVPVEKLEIAVGGAGVDLERYALPEQGDPKRAQARRQLGVPDHWRQVVGWVGPVTRRHGGDDLVAAIEDLRRTHPSVGWLVVPRGRYAAGQERRLRRLEKRGFVRVVSPGAEGDEIYRALDVLAWFGRPSTPHDAVAEAAAVAVPAVGYDTPGMRSMVEPGQTGHLVDSGDRLGLVSTLTTLLDDPGYLSDMGWRARARAGLRLARRDVDDQILRLYDRVLDQKLAMERQDG